jgi:dynein heavy chain
VVVSIASSKKSLEESQNKILELLAVSTGMILDDVVLIQTLEVSKADSIQIIKNIEATTQIEEKLNASRNIYVPVAVRGTVLYFVVSGLSGIDPMYQYSLSYFKKLFRTALNEAEPSEIVQLRIQNLNEKATRIVFTDVSCGLFESHKKIFSFLICTAIKRQSKAISDIGWSLLLRGAGIPPKDYK